MKYKKIAQSLEDFVIKFLTYFLYILGFLLLFGIGIYFAEILESKSPKLAFWVGTIIILIVTTLIIWNLCKAITRNLSLIINKAHKQLLQLDIRKKLGMLDGWQRIQLLISVLWVLIVLSIFIYKTIFYDELIENYPYYVALLAIQIFAIWYVPYLFKGLIVWVKEGFKNNS